MGKWIFHFKSRSIETLIALIELVYKFAINF